MNYAGWTIAVERIGLHNNVAQSSVTLGPPEMSLQKNVAGQKFTFGLVNASTGAALTGVAGSISMFVTLDGGSQSAAAGSITETGNGGYNYAPTQGETNGNEIGFLVTQASAIPMNLMFLTAGGIHRNVSGQVVTFCMASTAGAPDPGATVSIFITKDGTQASGGGSVTNLGNAQYRYALTQAETNCVNLSVLATASGDVIQNLNMFTIP